MGERYTYELRRATPVRQCLAVAAALSLTACAIVTVRGPDPAHPVERKPTCTTSIRASQIDYAIGIAGMLGLIIVGGIQKDVQDNEDGAVLIVSGVAVGAAFATSATVGYFRARRCQRAVDSWERAQTDVPAPAKRSPY